MVRPALALALTAVVIAGCTRTDWHEPPARTDDHPHRDGGDELHDRPDDGPLRAGDHPRLRAAAGVDVDRRLRLAERQDRLHAVGGETPFARCDLRSGNLPVPPEVRGECIHDSGTSMVVDGDGARPGCVSDAVQGQSTTKARAAGWWREDFGEGSLGEAVLPYSRALDVGDGVGCESRITGMTCRVGEHGFTINDTAYTTW